MKKLIKKLIANESGASAIEYTLIAAVLAIGIIGVVTNLKTAINEIPNSAETTLNAN